MEQRHVLEVYRAIAGEFSMSRFEQWPRVAQFLDEHGNNRPMLADIGCGNGKNYDQRYDYIGVDFVPEFVAECCDKGLHAVVGSVLDIPIGDREIDTTICIAVIHHLDSQARRIAAIRELIRITRIGGHILISVWAKNQAPDSKYKFETNDVYVSWKGRQFIDAPMQRYYHVFDDSELLDLVRDNFMDTVDIVRYDSEHGNYYIELRRIA